MDELIILLFWILLGLCFLLRALFALFCPRQFAEGARKNLFIRERIEALFPGDKAKRRENCDFPDANGIENATNAAPQENTRKQKPPPPSMLK
ncbi:MAG: hypothetical protein KJ804_09375 [Proteobacteria bacterium]|nr:hypothetical protein [Pseudomonadota bacterium]MBU1058510.1 hypothetical protein [Pseudomonadota bacterium]